MVRYAANLNIGESYIDITNTGANGAPALGPGFGDSNAFSICANVYAFDPGEEMISCCSCLVTPDETVNLGVNRDLTAKTLTGAPVTSVTVKLLGSFPVATTGCTNAAALAASGADGNLIHAGMTAWGTTIHAAPKAGKYAVTATRFTPAALSAGELASITGRCAGIIGNGSGYGICTSCRSGSLGAEKLPG
jgi:hypothetical protein